MLSYISNNTSCWDTLWAYPIHIPVAVVHLYQKSLNTYRHRVKYFLEGWATWQLLKINRDEEEGVNNMYAFIMNMGKQTTLLWTRVSRCNKWSYHKNSRDIGTRADLLSNAYEVYYWRMCEVKRLQIVLCQFLLYRGKKNAHLIMCIKRIESTWTTEWTVS